MDTYTGSIRSVALPVMSRAAGYDARTDLADAFSVRLPDSATDDPEQLARFIFTQQPAWIERLMKACLRRAARTGWPARPVGA